MNWLVKFFQSSLGQKVIMSLTGLFLSLFLLVHCAGNCLLFLGDDGAWFNFYGDFMSHNPLIKLIAYGLYLMILVHAIKGITLALYNRGARGDVGYTVANGKSAKWYTKQMAVLGSILFIFIAVHMSHFWWSVQMGTVPTIHVGEEEVEDLYTQVAAAFKIEWIVVFYALAQFVLGFHLIHGFQSAFQTLGINHSKYTPIIKFVGMAFGIVVPFLFLLMPIYFYFVK